MEDLSLEELELLFKGYNWWGKHEQSFEAARLALRKEPKNLSLLKLAALGIRNCTAGNGYASKATMSWFEKCIKDNVGLPAFWHVQRAVEYYDLATQPPDCEDFIEWLPGDPVYDPTALHLAYAELSQAVSLDPTLKNDKEAWLGGGLCYETTWDEYFRALLEVPEYRLLMDG
jgi:hypothetical protein